MSANSDLVQATYKAIVGGLTPSTTDAAIWTAQLDSGAYKTADLVLAIENSPIVQTVVNAVIREYQAAFGRVPDQAGLAYWVGVIAPAGVVNASQLANLNATFATSTEFATRNGLTGAGLTAASVITPTNGTALVQALYSNILGRQPDAAGLSYWLNAKVTVTQLLQAFASSSEFVTLTTAAVTGFENAEAAGTAPTTGSLFTAFPAPAQTLTLTTGIDTIVGSSGADTINASSVLVGTTQTSTLSALDSIDGAGGQNIINVVDATGALAIPSSATVKNIQTANLISSGTLTGNVSGWTGLTTVTATEIGGSAGGSLTAAATTAVSLTDSAAAASTISVQGGSTVSVTASGVTAGGVINVGTVSAAAGAVTVAESMAAQVGANTADAINVTGGTTIAVTANLNETAGAGNTVTGGIITVNGSGTTAVTVTQTASATAAAAVTASTGALAVGLVTAAPGVQGVAAVSASASTAAKAAVAGVVDGKVVVADTGAATAQVLATVTLANYGAASSITDNALTTLNLSGKVGTLTLTRTVANSSPTLALNLNTVSGTNTITDANNEITTLNVTTSTKDSTLAAFTDTGLTTLNVAGTNVLALTAVNGSLTTIAVTGGAGFNGDVSGLGAALASFTTTSSGVITATLSSTTQTFVGSTGQDIITIAADATKVITGGSGTTDEIVLNFNAAAITKTTTNVTGFETLGVGAASQGVYDVSTFKTITGLDVTADGAAAVTFTKVTAGTALAIDAVTTQTYTYQTADASGSADSVTVTLGASTNKAAFNTAALVLKDLNDVGIGTVSIVSNDSTFGDAQTIGTLTDNGLSTLNVSGNAGLTITTLSETATQATSFTLNNTSTGAAGVTISTLTDANLGQLTFTGSGSSTVGGLSLSGKVLGITNSGTGTASVGAITAAALTSLTLTGQVAFGANSATPDTAIGATTGVTISGSGDNQHVNINLTGAAAASTDTITLGNGNNNIKDGSTAGVVNVTVGTGANLIDVSAGTAATFGSAVTLGTHTSSATVFDQVKVSYVNGQTSGLSSVITGAATNDHVVFTDATATTVLTLSAAQQNIITADASLTAAIAHAFGDSTAAHQAIGFTYGGNTYVIDNVAADTALSAGVDTVIELVGVHTIAAGAVVGHIVVAS